MMSHATAAHLVRPLIAREPTQDGFQCGSAAAHQRAMHEEAHVLSFRLIGHQHMLCGGVTCRRRRVAGVSGVTASHTTPHPVLACGETLLLDELRNIGPSVAGVIMAS